MNGHRRGKSIIRAALVAVALVAITSLAGSAAPVRARQADDCTQTVAPGGLQAALDGAAPNDVICAEPGDYRAEGELRFTVSGELLDPITVRATGPDTIVEGMVIEEGVSDLRIDGFVVEGYAIWGVTVAGGNQNVYLSGLAISGGESGIHLAHTGQPVQFIGVLNTLVQDVLYTAIDCTPGPCHHMTFREVEVTNAGRGNTSYGADALAVEQGSYITVENCYFHDNSGDGIDLNSRDDGPVPGIVVYGNRVVNHQLNGIKLWNGGTVINNLVWNASGALVTEPGTYLIAYNTFANNLEHGYLGILGGYGTAAPASVRLANNIFYNDNPAMGGTLLYVAAGVELEADHNLYYNPYREEDVICLESGFEEACAGHAAINDGSWTAETGLGAGSLYADPLFVDAAQGMFWPGAGSPALDVGVALEEYSPVEDLAGTARPVGDGPDIGAFEAQ